MTSQLGPFRKAVGEVAVATSCKYTGAAARAESSRSGCCGTRTFITHSNTLPQGTTGNASAHLSFPAPRRSLACPWLQRYFPSSERWPLTVRRVLTVRRMRMVDRYRVGRVRPCAVGCCWLVGKLRPSSPHECDSRNRIVRTTTTLWRT